jgi:hypothetical protein
MDSINNYRLVHHLSLDTKFVHIYSKEEYYLRSIGFSDNQIEYSLYGHDQEIRIDIPADEPLNICIDKTKSKLSKFDLKCDIIIHSKMIP